MIEIKGACGTCRHWIFEPPRERKSDREYGEQELWERRYGRCGRIKAMNACVVWEGRCATFAPDGAAEPALVVDGDGADYSLIVHERFGCTLFDVQQEPMKTT